MDTDSQTPNRMSQNLEPPQPQKPTKRRLTKKTKLVGLGVIVGVVAVVSGTVGAGINQLIENSQDSVLPIATEDGNSDVTADEESIAAVARSGSPSVVSVITSSRTSSPLFNRDIEQEGAGTGIIVSSNGYVLTNKHVIQGADTVTVVLPNGTTYEKVKVVGSDPLNDIAFLKIPNAKRLPTIILGDSKTIRIGQSVVAIGNALGQYQNTVTSGIISGTGRPVVASSDGTSNGDSESLNDLIQTDAAINSGNSGGPLLNLKGQVIGINTAIAADAQGIGFAIPIGAAKGMLQHLIKTGKFERPYLGVQYISITPEVKDEYELPVAKGDYVYAERGRSVQVGGPADKAGIKDGDIITSVNGYRVGEVASVSSLISEYEPGSKVDITVLRDGRQLRFRATLGTYKG